MPAVTRAGMGTQGKGATASNEGRTHLQAADERRRDPHAHQQVRRVADRRGPGATGPEAFEGDGQRGHAHACQHVRPRPRRPGPRHVVVGLRGRRRAHDVCPQPVQLSAVDPAFEEEEGERANPFAVLGNLRPPKS